MTITDLQIQSLSPMLADVRFNVHGTFEPGDDIRCRVLGPRCEMASTVEIAYPGKPLEAQPASKFQALIPEPSLWSATCPFYYEANVEQWRGGRRVEKVATQIQLKK